MSIFDGKVKIKDSATDLFDGKIKIVESVVDLFDGKVSVNTPIDLFDGKIKIKDSATDLFDSKATSCSGCTLAHSGILGKHVPQANSGLLGFSVVSAGSGIRGSVGDLESKIFSGIKGADSYNTDIGSGVACLSLAKVKSGISGKESLVVRSMIIGGKATVPPGNRIWAVFNRKNMDNISSTSSQEDLATVLRVLFDYNYGKKTFCKAVQLEAKEAIRKYGRIEKEIQAYWITSFRTAVQMGERILKYHARPKWSVSFVSDLDYADIPSGVWVSLEDHPLIPFSGPALVTDAPLDLSIGEVSFTVEKTVGNPVEVKVTGLSEAYEPLINNQLAISYNNGIVTFTILNELNQPLGGASVMLDGTINRTTDSKGQVQFTTTRGNHRLLVEASGYAPLEFEVQV